MCNSRPVYRAGKALALRRTRSDSEPSGDLISLTGDQAVQLGEEFLGRETSITNDISRSVIDAAAKLDSPIALVETADKRSEDARLDFAHGVIVDFQNAYFESALFKHRTRVCVTVCQHGTKSKIWFRSQCVGFRERQDKEWYPAIDMSEARITAFFDQAHHIGELALSAVQSIYDEHLKCLIVAELGEHEAHLHIANRFEFRTFDSDSERLETLYYKLKRGDSFTETLKDNLEKQPGDIEPAMTAVNVALPEFPDPLLALASLKDDEKFSVVDHASAVGDIGIFVRELVEETDEESALQLFSGAAFDPSADNPDKDAIESPAYRVATEMLATVTAEI